MVPLVRTLERDVAVFRSRELFGDFPPRLALFAVDTYANVESTDGANPEAWLVQGSIGSFYGTTSCVPDVVRTVFLLTIVPKLQVVTGYGLKAN
ncbi:MAG TPA: hypothetical protein VGR14_20440 [Verrucomicrobiae bacterium]|jgi:hypothetical protein|nr:hypothetical protein [Verrucomicrobiae bacterium]